MERPAQGASACLNNALIKQGACTDSTGRAANTANIEAQISRLERNERELLALLARFPHGIPAAHLANIFSYSALHTVRNLQELGLCLNEGGRVSIAVEALAHAYRLRLPKPMLEKLADFYISMARPLGTFRDELPSLDLQVPALSEITNIQVILLQVLPFAASSHVGETQRRAERGLELCAPVAEALIETDQAVLAAEFCEALKPILLHLRSKVGQLRVRSVLINITRVQAQAHVELEEFEGAGEKFLEAFEEASALAVMYPEDPQVRGFVVQCLTAIGNFFRWLRRPEEATLPYSMALGFCQVALENGVAEPLALTDTSRIHVFLSYIYRSLDNEQQSLYHCRIGLLQARMLYHVAKSRLNFGSVDQPRIIHYVDGIGFYATAVFGLGELRKAQGRLRSAYFAYRYCLRLGEGAVAISGTRPELTRNMIIAHERLGEISGELGWPEAKSYHEERLHEISDALEGVSSPLTRSLIAN